MKINKIIKYLILSDIAFFTGWGLITPIFPIFIVDKIIGGTALVVGIASAIYWITKAFLEFPIGTLLDKYAGEKDDYVVLISGFFIASLIPFGYIFAIYPYHIYLLQFFYAIGMAMAIAGWRGIFTRNIDKGKEATEWSLDSSLIGFGMGIAGIISGYIVLNFGFITSFIFAGTFGMISILIIFSLRKEMKVSARGVSINIIDFLKDRRKTKHIHPNIKDIINNSKK